MICSIEVFPEPFIMSPSRSSGNRLASGRSQCNTARQPVVNQEANG